VSGPVGLVSISKRWKAEPILNINSALGGERTLLCQKAQHRGCCLQATIPPRIDRRIGGPAPFATRLRDLNGLILLSNRGSADAPPPDAADTNDENRPTTAVPGDSSIMANHTHHRFATALVPICHSVLNLRCHSVYGAGASICSNAHPPRRVRPSEAVERSGLPGGDTHPENPA
jgi:hypothetical protein